MEDPGLCILVVDGDHASRGSLSALVGQAGHHAIEAAEPEEACAQVQRFRPDMVIVQHGQANLDSLALVRRIRAMDACRPYIALVACGTERKQLNRLPDTGVDDVVDKPVKADIFAAHLRAGERIIRLQQENERQKQKLQQYSQELICSNLRLRELAMTDDLTGLPNRRYSLELMQQEWLAAAKGEQPLACMVIDLDGLKQINDEQGLERGDVVIKTVAAIMRRYLPPRDTVCRISGDEFLVICPGVSLLAAMACGEKLVGLIRSFNIHAQGCLLELSIGVAERRPGIGGPQELINLAERAMHHAKHAGRGQVVSGHGGEKRSQRKAKREFALWPPADALGMAAASA